MGISSTTLAPQDLGNTCYMCGKKFDLFRSMLLPHYCGHFYEEITQGHEDYFTDTNCKLCGATATKRKSRIIGVKHRLVLPFINEVLKSRNQIEEHQDAATLILRSLEEKEEEPRSDDTQNEFVIDESEVKSENEEHYEDHNGVQVKRPPTLQDSQVSHRCDSCLPRAGGECPGLLSGLTSLHLLNRLAKIAHRLKSLFSQPHFCRDDSLIKFISIFLLSTGG